MIDKIANGWELAKASGRVQRLDKQLLVFPFFERNRLSPGAG